MNSCTAIAVHLRTVLREYRDLRLPTTPLYQLSSNLLRFHHIEANNLLQMKLRVLLYRTAYNSTVHLTPGQIVRCGYACPTLFKAGGVSILVGRELYIKRTFLGTHAQGRPSDHVVSACRTQRTAVARRPAQLCRQASRFTMLRLLALALCGEAVLQPHTTTVAKSGSCEQPALFAIVLHGQLPRTRDIAVLVSVSGLAWFWMPSILV